MLTVFCFVVGDGSLFSIKIDKNETVDYLKKKIKEENENMMKCDAKDLQLYLALKNNEWLGDEDDDLRILEIMDENNKGIWESYLHESNKMKPTKALMYYFSDNLPSTEQIHILVKLPHQNATTSVSIDIPLVHPHRLERWERLNKVLNQNKKVRINEGGLSTAYSSSRWNDVGPIFDPDMKQYKESIKPIPEQDMEILMKVLTWIVKCYHGRLLDLNDNEAKRLHLIAPILWSVVQLLPDVTIYIEKDLNGKRVHAHGHFEFVLVRQMKRICIVEAKQEQFQQGVSQALLGCEVAADLDGIHEVYGVVTNFEKWIFLRNKDEEILQDEMNPISYNADGKPNEQLLSIVVGKLHSLLC